MFPTDDPFPLKFWLKVTSVLSPLCWLNICNIYYLVLSVLLFVEWYVKHHLTNLLCNVALLSLACKNLKNVIIVTLKETCKTVHFYSARNAHIASTAVLATAIPSVHLSFRPSVCPLHAGIVSKRRHVARCSLHCWIAKCI